MWPGDEANITPLEVPSMVNTRNMTHVTDCELLPITKKRGGGLKIRLGGNQPSFKAG